MHILSCSFRGSKPYEYLEGMHIHRVGERNTFNYFVPFKYKELERRYDFSLVIEDLNKLPFYTNLYSKKPKLAILHHLFGKSIFEETNFIFGAYVLLYERSIPIFYKNIPFVVVSESTKEELVKMGFKEENISVIYNGIDTEFFKPSEKSPTPLVVYINRIRKYKRPDLALKVFKLVSERVKDVEFVIVGDGPYMKVVKEMARELGIDVKFTGFVSEEGKARILSSAWVLVNTSAKEGWGLVNMEAFASGTPVVGFRVHGVKDSVKDGYNGFLSDYEDIYDMSEKVVEIIENENLRRMLSKNARKFAEKYTWDNSAKEFEKVIKELIQD